MVPGLAMGRGLLAICALLVSLGLVSPPRARAAYSTVPSYSVDVGEDSNINGAGKSLKIPMPDGGSDLAVPGISWSANAGGSVYTYIEPNGWTPTWNDCWALHDYLGDVSFEVPNTFVRGDEDGIAVVGTWSWSRKTGAELQGLNQLVYGSNDSGWSSNWFPIFPRGSKGWVEKGGGYTGDVSHDYGQFWDYNFPEYKGSLDNTMPAVSGWKWFDANAPWGNEKTRLLYAFASIPSTTVPGLYECIERVSYSDMGRTAVKLSRWTQTYSGWRRTFTIDFNADPFNNSPTYALASGDYPDPWSNQLKNASFGVDDVLTGGLAFSDVGYDASRLYRNIPNMTGWPGDYEPRPVVEPEPEVDWKQVAKFDAMFEGLGTWLWPLGLFRDLMGE